MTQSPQTPPPPVQYAPAPPKPGNGLAVAGMVLGIVALVLFCIWWLSLPCSIVGLILSGLGLKRSRETGTGGGMAKAGLICSIIALALMIIAVIIAVIWGASVMSAMQSSGGTTYAP